MILTDAMKNLITSKINVGLERSVVLVDVGGRKDISDNEYNWNLYCIDDNQRVVWQVSGVPSKHNRDSFVAIYLEGNVLKADRFFGGEYKINIGDGVAEETGWHK